MALEVVEAACVVRVLVLEKHSTAGGATQTFRRAGYEGDDVYNLATTAAPAIVPAMAFYGGLGDLLATAAMGDWTEADEAHIAYGLNSWAPTDGTRAAGTNDDLPTLKWPFPDPLGLRDVIGEFTMADGVTIPSHLSIPEARAYMTTEAARGLSAPDTPTPTAVDEKRPASSARSPRISPWYCLLGGKGAAMADGSRGPSARHGRA